MNTTDYLLRTALDANVALVTPKQEHSYGDLKAATLKLLEVFHFYYFTRVAMASKLLPKQILEEET